MSLATVGIPWQEFDLILGARNIFSLRSLNIRTMEHAKSFLTHCGFSPDKPFQKRQFDQLFTEAVFFIRHHLLQKSEREMYAVPQCISALQDPCLLLIFASDLGPKRRYVRTWSCLILKIMYVITLIQLNGKLSAMSDARDIIFKRIKDHVNEDSELQFYSHGVHIPLKKIEWKEAKTRASMILKMLYKPQTDAENIHDYLGVRFIVENDKYIPHLIKGLIDTDILIPHQTISLRTRNNLIDIDKPKKIITFFKGLCSNGTLSVEEFDEICERISWRKPFGVEPQRDNVFSSQHYKSLQFTVQHLIRSKNPAYQVIESMTQQLYHHTGVQKYEPWIDTIIQEYSSHYFPFEIQIMDDAGYQASKSGLASHDQYKSNQLQTARERVLSQLLKFNAEKLKSQHY